MSSKGLIVLAAGGTGGHLFPAQALAESLIARGYDIHLMTDERVRDYGKNFPASQTHVVHAASPSLKKPFSFLKLYGGYRKAKAILRKLKPVAVAGFGGYPSFPPLMAAASLGIPTLVHEQNAVLGRANKFLAGRVDAVASSFENVIGFSPEIQKKLTFTGNPIRAIALKEQDAPFPSLAKTGKFNLVIFGGSQGAKFFSDFMPEVFAALPSAAIKRLKLTQQCRAEDLARVSAAYSELDLDSDLQPFFLDMPHRLALSHLVICRSGASTIAELGVIGRPAVMVPLPHALDNDQLKNAESFAHAGAGWVKPQMALKPAEFASFLEGLMAEPAVLKKAANLALSHGKPDAAERLADLAEKIAARRTV
jgi:UDP-N-acetylglucosamine--N-acetylmuramyl-(pentapeptide) pyrophosphoryl-undecaprenol N-acetylglucosamine transferase